MITLYLAPATNTAPCEQFLPFPRRSMLGRSLPTWLITPNTVLLKRFVRSKSEPLCDEVELLDANPKTALVRFPDGRESTVSVSDFAQLSDNEPCDVPETTTENCTSDTETVQSETGQNGHAGHDANKSNQTVDLQDQPSQSLRRSTRIRRPPDRFGDYVSH